MVYRLVANQGNCGGVVSMKRIGQGEREVVSMIWIVIERQFAVLWLIDD